MSEDHTLLPSLAVLGGTGEQGRGLALRWSAAGYQVTIGSRSLDRARAEVEKLNELHTGVNLAAADNKSAAISSDIVVLTVTFKLQQSTVEDISLALV